MRAVIWQDEPGVDRPAQLVVETFPEDENRNEFVFVSWYRDKGAGLVRDEAAFNLFGDEAERMVRALTTAILELEVNAK